MLLPRGKHDTTQKSTLIFVQLPSMCSEAGGSGCFFCHLLQVNTGFTVSTAEEKVSKSQTKLLYKKKKKKLQKSWHYFLLQNEQKKKIAAFSFCSVQTVGMCSSIYFLNHISCSVWGFCSKEFISSASKFYCLYPRALRSHQHLEHPSQ